MNRLLGMGGYDISIHALREEGDSAACRQTTMSIISIHALREEGDDNMLSTKLESSVFLSTPSARRATHTLTGLNLARGISTHALREEGDAEIMGGSVEVAAISTHALREEGDCPGGCIPNSSAHFYPRPPRGGRPSSSLGNAIRLEISIHALREEGDLCVHHFHNFVLLFLSTPSVRRATCEVCCGRRCTGVFLSTPSARRATWSGPWRRPSHRHFYPRPP